jgi:integrase
LLELLRLFAVLEPERSSDRDLGPLRDLTALALYSGVRIEEGSSLRTDNVVLGPVPYLNVPGTKSPSAVRLVPIHSVILPLVTRLVSKSTDGYLIPGLTAYAGRDSKRAIRIGSAFSRLKRAAGFPSGLVFHGLRRSFIAALERAQVPESTTKLIVGHARGLTYGTYSRTLPVEVLAEAVGRVSFGAVDKLVDQNAKS